MPKLVYSYINLGIIIPLLHKVHHFGVKVCFHVSPASKCIVIYVLRLASRKTQWDEIFESLFRGKKWGRSFNSIYGMNATECWCWELTDKWIFKYEKLTITKHFSPVVQESDEFRNFPQWKMFNVTNAVFFDRCEIKTFEVQTIFYSLFHMYSEAVYSLQYHLLLFRERKQWKVSALNNFVSGIMLVIRAYTIIYLA